MSLLRFLIFSTLCLFLAIPLFVPPDLAPRQEEWLINRNWLFNYPKPTPRDHGKLYAFLRTSHGDDFLYIEGSDYRWTVNRGTWEVKGNELILYWLQEGWETRTPFKIEECKQGFYDLRLELVRDPRNGHDKVIYYSRKDKDIP